MSEEQLKMAKNMGALGYDNITIASIMSFDLSSVVQMRENSNHPFTISYNHGANMSAYLIDLKLFEMAQSGDIKALDKLEERKKLRSLQAKRNR